ncbi:DUF397 domain-containing protein [Streptomyces resistomycificus]|uniref:DUF397 domain-containing protein n=1 Tax=Streptomyces resistomycificus TaxID=67356 RepID=A0A0L8LY91_9ACTN|nr:DUF397 domain-containing protein [Streptomyces resistomycificus]KOG43128.1 hypothetical protein ADK37_02510 [Streptomyces resistomycificus]KUN93068.1 hypothetical protein AQJ84_31220 [Streptomyces resistomycificus]
MTTPYTWRKSSYSGGGEGNACVEVAAHPTHIAIRDSKAPAKTPLTIPAGAFTAFLDGVKNDYSTVTDFARFRG